MNHLSTYQIFEAVKITDPIQTIKKLNWYKKVKYTLNTDNSIDVEGNVVISSLNLTEMPVKFGKVSGDFNCSVNKLTSLEHCPVVTGNFNCSDNLLTSLEHAPITVTGYFDCSINKLTSLIHGPITVTRDFSCSNNLLTSLEGCPITVSGDFYFANNKFPKHLQKKIDDFKGTWQELINMKHIWNNKKLNNFNNKTGLYENYDNIL
jgi:hypothetical protein